MSKARLEAFSDGVIAILITIMVLEMKIPHGADWAALQPLRHTFWAYVLSFLFLGAYWKNHHDLFHMVEHLNGRVVWANLHLLFWLSLVPFVTGWMGESHNAPLPTALYGGVLITSALAYTLLQDQVIRAHGLRSAVAQALGADVRSRMWMLLYIPALPAAFLNVWVADLIFATVTLVTLIPQHRKWGAQSLARIVKGSTGSTAPTPQTGQRA